MGAAVLCEGVENQKQAEIAKAAGCDMLQGFYYYFPMEAEKMEDLLRDLQWTALFDAWTDGFYEKVKKFKKRLAKIKKLWYSVMVDYGQSSGAAALRMLREERIYKMDILKQITQEQIRTDLPATEIGDTVKVYVKVKEGNRERVQMFEGTVIKKNHGGIQETFTVRRVSYGVGVERTFPVNSPKIDRIEVVRHGKVRRAKLYYLRDRVGKAAKVKEKLK